MEAERDAARGTAGRVLIGFVVLAFLLGPVTSSAAGSLGAVFEWQMLAGGAVASSIAGCTLVGAGLVRRARMPNARQWLALGALLVPRVLDRMLAVGALRPWLHETRWGVTLLIAVAAPLWLGLLAALGIVAVEVPRRAIAACLAGVSAVLLVLPTDAYALAGTQAAMLLVRLLVGIATVFAWWFAQRRLRGAAILSTAGLFLLMSAAVSAVSSFVVERAAWQAVDWRAAIVPVLLGAVLLAASSWLWFYLLTRMRLTAFSLHPLAVWTASLVTALAGEFFVAWRIDLAAAITLAAIAVGLRAQGADEQPTTLGLGVG